MKVVWKTTEFDYPITLKMGANGLFQVIYGKQVTKDLSYSEACRNLGEAMLHALTLEGKTDP